MKLDMKVLLIFPGPKQSKMFPNNHPPLGILSISSFLESKGIQTEIWDQNIKNGCFDVADFDVVAMSSNISNTKSTLELTKNIKKEFPEKKVIVGGPQATCYPQVFLEDHAADAVVVGEGEYTLLDYLKNKDKTKVSGIYLKKGKKIYFTGNRPNIKDLDSLPFPNFQKIQIEKYNTTIKKRKPVSAMATSRGCPYNCSFCFHQLGYSWRARSAENVIDEIEWQVDEIGAKEIEIVDDNFTLDLKRVNDICDGILRRGIDVKIQLASGIRVDKINKEILSKLYDAGCWMTAIAPETGDIETLNKINKGFDLDRVKLVLKWCKDIGIKTYTMFMLGFPWETRENIQNTIDFASDIDTDFIQFTKFTPLPKTLIYKNYNFSETTEDLINKESFFLGADNKSEIEKMIRWAYKKNLMRPKTISKLLKTFYFTDIIKMTSFAIRNRIFL